MINLVDLGAPLWRGVIRALSRDVEYVADGVSGTVPAYLRGVRPQELVASALQGDVWAYICCDDFARVFTERAHPQRFDRLRTFGQSFSVEGYRPAPTYDCPVVFKIMLRGGTQ